MDLFKGPSTFPFQAVLMSHAELAEHPMMQQDYLNSLVHPKDCRKSELEFEKLFQQLPDERDRQYPPDDRHFFRPEFWGLPMEGPA